MQVKRPETQITHTLGNLWAHIIGNADVREASGLGDSGARFVPAFNTALKCCLQTQVGSKMAVEVSGITPRSHNAQSKNRDYLFLPGEGETSDPTSKLLLISHWLAWLQAQF
jgi:hypothetical protein